MIKKYSVLMPLYKHDIPDFFVLAIESMLNQTIEPNEIVIVCDGELSRELNRILKEYEEKYDSILKIYRFKKNRGLGLTLADGISLCSNEIIARMDADDFSVKERCEKQLKFLNVNKDIDVVGSNVLEFTGTIEEIVSEVNLPQTSEEIEYFARRRCPIRHPALMYKKSKVLSAGNYNDYRRAQDYDLIVRMILNGSNIYNIQENLVYMRVDDEFYERRGGIDHVKIILRLKYNFYKLGFYSLIDFIISGLGNAIISLLPNTIRKTFYKRVLRR